jgi:hypothetical protein
MSRIGRYLGDRKTSHDGCASVVLKRMVGCSFQLRLSDRRTTRDFHLAIRVFSEKRGGSKPNGGKYSFWIPVQNATSSSSLPTLPRPAQDTCDLSHPCHEPYGITNHSSLITGFPLFARDSVEPHPTRSFTQPHANQLKPRDMKVSATMLSHSVGSGLAG